MGLLEKGYHSQATTLGRVYVPVTKVPTWRLSCSTAIYVSRPFIPHRPKKVKQKAQISPRRGNKIVVGGRGRKREEEKRSGSGMKGDRREAQRARKMNRNMQLWGWCRVRVTSRNSHSPGM